MRRVSQISPAYLVSLPCGMVVVFYCPKTGSSSTQKFVMVHGLQTTHTSKGIKLHFPHSCPSLSLRYRGVFLQNLFILFIYFIYILPFSLTGTPSHLRCSLFLYFILTTTLCGRLGLQCATGPRLPISFHGTSQDLNWGFSDSSWIV